MRIRGSAAALAVLFTSATVGTCVFPTEHDGDVFVTIDSLTIEPAVRRVVGSTAPVVLIRGDEGDAHGTAWQRTAAGGRQPIANVRVIWSFDDTTKARIDRNTGHFVAVNSGTTMLHAAAANFDKRSAGAAQPLRVSAPLEIDSIRPASVKYGETITIYGVGVDSILLARLGPADLIPYLFSASRDTTPSGDTTGLARISFWVPPPAHNDQLFFVGNGVFGTAQDSVEVVERDLYEPDERTPHVLDLTGPPLFPQLPFLQFFNPALAFEHLRRDEPLGADWYQLQTGAGSLTIILNSSFVGGKFFTFISDSLAFTQPSGYFIGSDAWTIGPGSHDCHGLAFAPPEAASESTVVSLTGMPAGSLDAIAIYSEPGPYAFAVINGFVPTDNSIQPDAHEEDDFCSGADARGTETLPFNNTLTIDTPHDIDWIRFTVPGARLVRFQMTVLSSAEPDTAKDLDLYLIQVPSPGDAALQVFPIDTTASSTVDKTIPVGAGDYYVVALDFAGTVTPYAICAGGCTMFPSGRAAAPQALRSQVTTRRTRLRPDGKSAPVLILPLGRSPGQLR